MPAAGVSAAGPANGEGLTDAQGPANAEGLTDVQVAARTAAGLTNHAPAVSGRSLGNILRANVFTLFNTVVLASFLLLLLLGQWRDALFGLAALANTLIGTVQEIRAKRLLDKMALLHASRAHVLRDGLAAEIPVEDVVVDDLLMLRAGDQVPADALVLAGNLEVDESLLSGEADPVFKTPSDTVLSGSFVMAGQGRAQVVRAGKDSYAGGVTARAKRFSLVNSELRNALNRVVRAISWALLPLMALVVNGQIQAEHGWAAALQDGTWRQAAVAAVASVISLIPQGLVLVTSIAFAVGALKLARSNVLLQELPAVEGLARVDMLCLDKTGTLTDGQMAFDAVHPLDLRTGWEQALGWFGSDPNANATARCLRSPFPEGPPADPLSSVSFSSARKWSAVSFRRGAGAGAWVVGAPDMVLAAAQPSNGAALELASGLAAAGRRTLVLAFAPRPMSGAEAEGRTLPPSLHAVAMLTFREQIRADAAATLAYFRDEGVGLRLISGDDPATVAAVAREVGLEFDADGYDGRDLPADPQQLAEVMEHQLVFGRVTPDQKLEMVRALQSSGHVVAMTGDGVNDTLALKEADIGIAMGSGATAARAVSRLVLLDGKFSRLPAVVAEGRQVIANVERVSMLFLAKTAYAVVLSLAYAALFWPFPFLPRQLSAVDGLTIGIPAFFLALMPNLRRYLAGFLRRSLAFAIPAGAVAAAVVVGVNAYARLAAGYPLSTVRSATVLALSLVGLWILLVLARPLNRLRRLLVAVMYLGLFGLFSIPFIRDFFVLAVPPPDLLAVSLLEAAAGCMAIEVVFRHHRRALNQSPGRTPAPHRPRATAAGTLSGSVPGRRPRRRH